MSKVLFGYTHVNDSRIPFCGPCGNLGNYMMAEQPGDDPLEIVLRCWCGSTNRGRFESMKERTEFINKHTSSKPKGD